MEQLDKKELFIKKSSRILIEEQTRDDNARTVIEQDEGVRKSILNGGESQTIVEQSLRLYKTYRLSLSRII